MSASLPLPCPDLTTAPAATPCPNKTQTLVATIIASSLAFVLGSIINVALPQMRADFDVGPAGAQWIVNAYLLPLGAFVLMGGALGDHYGRKKVFQVGLLVFAASCLLCAIAWSFPVLLAARALEGVAAAMIAP
ncbi:MAG: MFS transporter, partial [Pseudomonadota bacterium]